MERCFNTTGACFADEHYMLPPERRLGKILALLRLNKTFTLQAGPQTGRTTSRLWLEQHLPTLDKRALWLDVGTARDEPDPEEAFRRIFHQLHTSLAEGRPKDGLRAADPAQAREWLEVPQSAMRNYVHFLTAQDPRPLVLFVDQADCLVGDTMLTFLTQMRDGYMGRKDVPFPSSLVLVGIQTVCDSFLAREPQTSAAWLRTSFSFNISTESTTLAPFSEHETAELLHQHTETTGQRFEPAAIAKVRELAEGHPWLTNALADQVVRNEVTDRSVPVTISHIEAAKETIFLERRSHIASLLSQMREPWMRHVPRDGALGVARLVGC